MNFRKFNSLNIDEQNKYLDLVYQYVGVRFPEAYLKNSQTYIFCDDRSQMVGGFTLVNGEQSRSLVSLQIAQENFPIQYIQQLKTKASLEVNGLWLEKSYRGGVNSALFWMKLWISILICTPRKVIFTYSASNSKLKYLYSQFKETRILEAVTPKLEGMAKSEVEIISIVDLKDLIFLPLTQINFLFKRIAKI